MGTTETCHSHLQSGEVTRPHHLPLQATRPGHVPRALSLGHSRGRVHVPPPQSHSALLKLRGHILTLPEGLVRPPNA